MISNPPAGLAYTELAGSQDHHAVGASAWEAWDISAIVPAGARVVEVMVENIAQAAVLTFGCRDSGSALARLTQHDATVLKTMTMLCPCTLQTIEIYAQMVAGTHFSIIGYWA